MGKRSAAGELFLGNMGSIQRETRPSIQREDQLTMETELERIAAKARREPKLRFTSLAHHITRDRVRKNLLKIPKRSAAGVDGQTVAGGEGELRRMDRADAPIHSPPRISRAGCSARLYPQARQDGKAPIGRANGRRPGAPAQRGRSDVGHLRAGLPALFVWRRPKLSAHHALATLNEVIAGGKISWVLEADLKNFFGSLSHDWVLRFVEHRVGDPRLINLIRRWLKAGVMEDGAVHPSEEGTPQGGSISVLLSNLYLHYVLDLWFERVVKGRLRGEARLVRYIDDFVICFQYRSRCASACKTPCAAGWKSSA